MKPGPAIPAYDKMMWPTLLALKQLGDSGTNAEIEEKAIDIAGYTEQQIGFLHGSGPQTEVRYRMAWARSYLGNVGALENSGRAVWSITEYGRSLNEADMAAIPIQVRAKFKKRASDGSMEVASRGIVDDLPSPDAFDGTVFESWRDTLLQTLQAMSPSSFEKLSQRLLRESGFTSVDITGKSGDGGIDGVGVLQISLLNFRVFFQCKRYHGSVGAPEIRDFRGAMVGRTEKGLFITTGSFTPDAKREATRDGAPVLDLIDGERLCTLLKELSLGVTTRQVEEVNVDPAWFASL